MGVPGVRYAAIYKDQTEVPSFFQKLNAIIEMKEFEPQHFFEKNNKVGAFGRFKATERKPDRKWKQIGQCYGSLRITAK